jgi:hypothetical protein
VSAPILLRFTLDRWVLRVLALHPMPRPAGAVGGEPSRFDTMTPRWLSKKLHSLPSSIRRIIQTRGHPLRWRRRAWPTNPILTIPSTGETARNKCALSPMRSAIKGLGTQSYGSWQTTNFLLLGRKNEPTFWVPKTQVRQGADRDERGRTHGPRAETALQRGNREETRTGKSFGKAREVAKSRVELAPYEHQKTT